MDQALLSSRSEISPTTIAYPRCYRYILPQILQDCLVYPATEILSLAADFNCMDTQLLETAGRCRSQLLSPKGA